MVKILQVNFDYKSTWYQIEKSTTKAIAFVDKIDYYMLQRQIIKALLEQIDVEYPIYMKYAITSFDSIAWMWISVIVTMKRTAPTQSSCIIITKLLRSCI
jgi:hypothetical protein